MTNGYKIEKSRYLRRCPKCNIYFTCNGGKDYAVRNCISFIKSGEQCYCMNCAPDAPKCDRKKHEDKWHQFV